MLSEFPEYSTESVLNVTIFLPNVSTSVSGALSVWGPRRDPLYVVIPVTILYSLIFVTGLVGNISTCIVIARNRHMHTATNYYLFSLAISDLLLLISGLPPEMYYIWSKYPYIFGESFCRLTGLTAETSMNATVLTITAFTVERYVAICHPFLTHTVSKLSRAIKFVIAIWFIALFCAIPQAIQFGLVYEKNKAGEKVSEELKTCSVKNRLTYSFELSTVFFFFAPMSVITVLYILIGIRLHRAGDRRPDGLRGSRRGHGKSTRRVVKMLVVVVIAFFICWAPFQAQRLFAVHGSPTDSTTVLIYQTITYTSGLLYYLSTTVNPFLYNIMSHKFREAFKSTLSRCLSGKEVMRSELCGGSSEGRGPRFNYSVLSHRSVRANQSLSSGHSYIEQVDLNKRPLVVSFRRKDNAELNSNHISDPPASPEKRELLEIPRYENGNYQRKILVRSYVPRLSPKTKEKRSSSPRIPRIEDIEIFQESQLRITTRKKEDSSCPEYRRKEEDVNLVKKSYTVPCLVMN